LTRDGTAQYVINLNDGLEQRLSAHSSMNLTYSRIQPVGYSPFQFDRTGNLNQSSLGFDLGFGAQPGVVTSVPYSGALGYLSPIGGAYGSSYGGFGGFGGTTGVGTSGFATRQFAGSTLPTSPTAATFGGQPASGLGVGGVGGFGGLRGAAYQPALHLGLHTGFDFNAARSSLLGQEKWSPLNIDLLAYPLKRVAFYANATYDLNEQSSQFGSSTSKLSPIRGGIRWIAGDTRYLDTTYVYDPSSGHVTTVRAHLLSPLGKLWTLEALWGYQRGFGGAFFDPYSGTTEQFLLTRDLHCWQANIYYSTNPRQINFSISIKAFPLQQLLGVQQFGQLFNQGVPHTF
jgi:hypothetical protein